MLHISIPEREFSTERGGRTWFINAPALELDLEHSLISLSRWESKWKKSFLDEIEEKRLTEEELLDYIRCMCLGKPPALDDLRGVDQDTIMKIYEYIADNHSATQIYDRRPQRPGRKEIMTSELFYYYMSYFGIPYSCEKWHLGRLTMLIRVCSIKGGTSQQEMSLASIFAQNKAGNRARRAALHSPG